MNEGLTGKNKEVNEKLKKNLTNHADVSNSPEPTCHIYRIPY